MKINIETGHYCVNCSGLKYLGDDKPYCKKYKRRIFSSVFWERASFCIEPLPPKEKE
jgi:hypothetical protein